MKSRPRNAENRCAAELTKAVQEYGIDFEFIRVPVIGRTGPDITFPNPLNLVVDVKTRLEVPKKLFAGLTVDISYTTPLYSITQVKNLPRAWMGTQNVRVWNSVLVEEWLHHISIWANKHGAIPCLILHRPDMKYHDSAVVIWQTDIQPLRANAETARLLALPGDYRRSTEGKFGGYTYE